MRALLILLLLSTSLSFGQTRTPECLDLSFQFELFNWSIKPNSKVKLLSDLENYLRDTVYMKVNFTKNVSYDYDIKGIAIEVINSKTHDFEFSNSNQPDLICEVKYKNKWINLEKRKESWCCIPRSFVIPPNSYVTAILPCYAGTEIVTMRFRFSTHNGVMYSDEFTGTINPALLKELWTLHTNNNR